MRLIPGGIMFFGMALMTGVAHSARSEETAVGLSIEEAAGVARHAWPVTVGVPFGPGQLKNAEQLSLSAGGMALPLQAEVTAKWRDGSVKWLLVDTQCDLPASGKVDLSLRSGKAGVAPTASVKVTKEGESVLIDTGAISFKLTPTGGGIPEDVKRKGQRVSSGGRHDMDFVTSGPALNKPDVRGNWKREAPADAKPETLSATGAKAEVIVEQANALRATVLVKGWYEGNGKKACRFDVRVAAFAGQPFVRLQHTITYTEDPYAFFIRRLALRFDLDGTQDAVFGGEALHEAKANPGVYLLALGHPIQHNGVLLKDAPSQTLTYEIFDATNKKLDGMSGKNPVGFVDAWGSTAGLAVSVRDFPHLHPKELAVDSKGVTVGLWPAHGNLIIDARNSGYGQRIRGETTLNGVACGWAKTHEIWVDYHGAAEAERTAALGIAKAAQEPAWAAVDPKHVCDSGAMGVLAPPDTQHFPGMERQHETLWAWVKLNREIFHWDGFFDHGGILIEFDNHRQRYSGGPPNTWVWRDYAGWILNDGQLSHQIMRGWARSGWRQYMKMGEAVARNIGDETTIHYQNPAVKNAHPLGGAHRHDMLPWGAIVTTYGMDVLGNCDLWFMLGDLRARDVLRDYADNLSKGGPGLIEKHGVGALLCRLSEALGEPALLEKAKESFGADLNEAAKPNFRSWTDLYMPMILAIDISGDEGLKKGLLDAATAVAAHPNRYAPEILAWAYLQTKEQKYLDGLKAALTGSDINIDKAAANEGDPWHEEWAALRKRMDQMPAWMVKVYINTQYVGRYPSAIRALQAAGLDERAVLGSAPAKP